MSIHRQFDVLQFACIDTCHGVWHESAGQENNDWVYFCCVHELCNALQVAQVLVESVLQSGASNKVVEIVAGKQVEASSPDKWFANL